VEKFGSVVAGLTKYLSNMDAYKCVRKPAYNISNAARLFSTTTVRRRSCRTFSTHFEIFWRRVDGVIIYFFNSDFKFFDDASEFSVCSFYVVFIFS